MSQRTRQNAFSGTVMLVGMISALACKAEQGGAPSAKDGTPQAGDRVTVELLGNKLVSGVLEESADGDIQIATSTQLEAIPRRLIVTLKKIDPSEEGAGEPKEAVKGRPSERPSQSTDRLVELLAKGSHEPSESRSVAATALPSVPNAPRLPEGFVNALKWLEVRNAENLTATLKKFANGSPEELTQADLECQQRFHCSLKDFVVKSYLQTKCEACKGEGIWKCKRCGGHGYTIMWVEDNPSKRSDVRPGTRVAKDQQAVGFLDPSVSRIHRRIDLCAFCRGQGFEPCEKCWGTRRQYIPPGPYERQAYADKLVQMAEELLYKKEHEYGDTPADTPPGEHLEDNEKQVWLRDSANRIKSDILRFFQAEHCINCALSADPSLCIRSPKDLFQETTHITVRLRHLYSELHERNRCYAENRMSMLLEEAKTNSPERGKIVGDR